jgi:hypothetical protein
MSQKILSTFTADQTNRLVRYTPVGSDKTRAHVMAFMALDGALRAAD